MPVAAVVGWPLTHTLSPVLHQAAYRAAGLTDWRYLARPTPPGELSQVIAEIRAGALAGVNVTVPHKQAVVPLVDELESPADELGAVNTVYRSEGQLIGANTDPSGVLFALVEQLELREGWDGAGPAVLLGTGGAALAVAFAWARLARAREGQGLATCPLTVVGRRPERAAVVAALAGRWGQAAAWDQAAELVAAAGVVLQATTLTAEGAAVPGQDRIRPGARVLDLNYGPQAQCLVKAARAAGAARAADGLGMLVAQAAGAVARIAGIRPDLPAMAAAVGLPWPSPPPSP